MTAYNKMKAYDLHFINVVSGKYQEYPEKGIIRYDLIVTTKINNEPHVLYRAVVDQKTGPNPIRKLISFVPANMLSSVFEFVDEFINA